MSMLITIIQIDEEVISTVRGGIVWTIKIAKSREYLEYIQG